MRYHFMPPPPLACVEKAMLAMRALFTAYNDKRG